MLIHDRSYILFTHNFYCVIFIFIFYNTNIVNHINLALPWKPTPSNLILISTGLWIWMAFVVGTIYRSNLKSMIILPTIRTPFNTLEEMIGQDEISYTMAAGGSFHQQALVCDLVACRRSY